MYRAFNSYEELVDYLVKELNLSKRYKEALLKYPREWFLPEDKAHMALVDAPIYLAEGQTTSQPYTILYMLKLLMPQRGDKVLEIGAGSGWQSAILSELVGKKGTVYAYEISPSIYELAEGNLSRLKIKNIKLIFGNALEKAPQNAPFDRIIAGASFSDEAINKITSWLKPNGIAVIPTIRESLITYKNFPENPIVSEDYGFIFVRGKE